jgi:hypothetical protein
VSRSCLREAIRLISTRDSASNAHREMSA